jgi:hypothetical protein
MAVPSGVPSLRQSSEPWTPSSFAKKSVPSASRRWAAAKEGGDGSPPDPPVKVTDPFTDNSARLERLD